MKKSLLLIAAITLLAACNAQEKTKKKTIKVWTLNGQEALYGKVSSVTYKIYDSVSLNRFGEFEKNEDEVDFYNFEFDRQGNLTKNTEKYAPQSWNLLLIMNMTLMETYQRIYARMARRSLSRGSMKRRL